MKIRNTVLLGLLTLWCTTLAFTQEQTAHFPTESWQHDPCNKIEGIRPFVIDSMNTTGILVIYDGKVVFSYGDLEELSYIASCRKSVLSILYGGPVQDGTIDLQKTLADLQIDDLQGLLPMEQTATIDDILTARSGVYHPSSYPGDDLAFAPKRGSQKPGTYFLYNNWDFNVAGDIFEQLTQTDLYDALENTLAEPLQMQDFDRSIQQKTGNLAASRYPAYPMHLSVRDMARIGYLMLRKGHWGDQQIVPAEWVAKITSVATPNEALNPEQRKASGFGYGYFWWIFDKEGMREELEGAYTAEGIYGQYLTVIPKLDLVIAHKTNALYQRHTTNYEQLLELIIDNAQHLKTKKEPVSESSFPKYLGTYSNGQMSMKIFEREKSLYIHSPLGELKLVPCDAQHFSIEQEDRFSLSFRLEEGAVHSFSLTPDTMKMGVFEKKK